MKILITITKGNMGGAQVVVFNMAKMLKERGHFVFVGIGEGEFLKNKLEKEDIPVHIFNSLKRTNNPFKNIKFVFEMKKYLNKEKFNVVHFNSSNVLLGAIGAKLSKDKPKTIFTFHGLSTLDSNYSNTFSKTIYWLVFKFLLFFIDKNIFVSYDNLEKAKSMKLIKSGHVVYNGLNQNPLNFIEKNTAIKIFESKTGYVLTNKFIIGSIGRLSKEKNYEFLIKIFPKILEIKPNAICIIIGGGLEKLTLKNLIKRLNLDDKIYLLGEIENAAKYLKIFDMFILPSLYEGLSISLIETILAEIPTIASNVGGNKEIIGENFTYFLDNEKEFLELFKKVYSNKINQDFEKQKKLFTASNMIDKLEKIYK